MVDVKRGLGGVDDGGVGAMIGREGDMSQEIWVGGADDTSLWPKFNEKPEDKNR